jgi:hypothetical protein
MLMLAVLAVWGVVLWRVFGREDASVAAVAGTPVAAGANDTLLLDYPDPFRIEVAVEAPPVVSRQEAPAPPPTQHRLRYMGRISRDGAAYGLVEINGSLHTLRRGEVADGYRVETLWRDSVRLRWKDEICVARL